ncbi:MAG: class I SAM-dependent methyltransferase [Solirubrobacterales bacterium]|nr:class I SAM-dependent methyltransferase [Solirubrobacterales bacterium]
MILVEGGDSTVQGSTVGDGFAAAWASVDGVEGWMTEGQARLLWDAASRVTPGGKIAEIGSYRGRSAIVIAKAAPAAGEVAAIDPHAGNDRGPQQIDGTAGEGEGDHDLFHANLKAAGVDDRIRHVRLPSQGAHEAIEGGLDMLYIDGAHRYGPAAADIRDWGARVNASGTMCIHDSFASVGVTLAQIRLLFFSPDWQYVGRSRSLAEYCRTPMSGSAKRSNVFKQLRELGWFARNVTIKVLLVMKLRPVAKLLDDGRGEWPY